jgi:SpoVK/Ycf46/Vps4 family AAA+-type ATPase
MDMESSKELLRRFTIARIPFIAINTIERSRALEALRDIAGALSLQFYVHTLSKGVCDITTSKAVSNDKSIYAAIDFIADQMRRKQYLTIVFTEIPDLSSDNDDVRRIIDLVMMAEESSGAVIVLSNNAIWSQLQRLGMIVKIDLPNDDEMYAIVKSCLERYQNDIPIEWDDSDMREAAAMLVGTTRSEAQNVITALVANKRINKADLDEVCFAKDRLFCEISGLERIEVDRSYKDVGGLKGLHHWLNEKKHLLTADMREEMRLRGLRPPRGILLVGVPGCGKSRSAKSIAASWKLPLYRLDFATVQGSYVGQSEKQLKDALATAENVSPCVLWIDEIEKGLAGSGSKSDGGVSTRMVGQFLFWLQECKKNVFVVATANDVTALPSELLRRGRFDELFFLDLPTANERKEILVMYAKKYLGADLSDLHIEKIVSLTDGFTGADIESTVREAAYHMLANNIDKLDEEELISTFSHVIPLSRTNPEKIKEIREWGKKRAVSASGLSTYSGDGD